MSALRKLTDYTSRTLKIYTSLLRFRLLTLNIQFQPVKKTFVTPEIVRSWKNLAEVAHRIHHHPDTEIGILIGRNIPSAFQPLSIIYGREDEPWAEDYKFG